MSRVAMYIVLAAASAACSLAAPDLEAPALDGAEFAFRTEGAVDEVVRGACLGSWNADRGEFSLWLMPADTLAVEAARLTLRSTTPFEPAMYEATALRASMPANGVTGWLSLALPFTSQSFTLQTSRGQLEVRAASATALQATLDVYFEEQNSTVRIVGQVACGLGF
ncbi:MAG: hypothetical protein AAGJ10_15645 [Bacteroidota bacterium]